MRNLDGWMTGGMDGKDNHQRTETTRLDHINIWINCSCRHSSSSSSIIFFFRDEELGWTDDGMDGWKGPPPPDRLRILYIKIKIKKSSKFQNHKRKLEIKNKFKNKNYIYIYIYIYTGWCWLKRSNFTVANTIINIRLTKSE